MDKVVTKFWKAYVSSNELHRHELIEVLIVMHDFYNMPKRLSKEDFDYTLSSLIMSYVDDAINVGKVLS